MQRSVIPIMLAAVIGAGPVLSTASTGAHAAPMQLPAPITAPIAAQKIAPATDAVPGAQAGGLLEKVQWRRRHHRRHFRRHHRRHFGRHHRRHHRRHHGFGGRIAAGIAGALALGIISNAGRVSRSRSAWERCDRRYRSFRWSDGTFQPYHGPRKLCPYLY